MSFLYVKIQVTGNNLETRKTCPIQAFLKDIWIAKLWIWNILTIRFCFFLRNKVTTEIIQIPAERELLFMEYKMQTQTGEKVSFTHLIT